MKQNMALMRLVIGTPRMLKIVPLSLPASGDACYHPTLIDRSDRIEQCGLASGRLDTLRTLLPRLAFGFEVVHRLNTLRRDPLDVTRTSDRNVAVAKFP